MYLKNYSKKLSSCKNLLRNEYGTVQGSPATRSMTYGQSADPPPTAGFTQFRVVSESFSRVY